MRQELTQRLYDTYPDLFVGKNETVMTNLMPFGLECDDGWYGIIDKACAHLLRLAELEGAHPKFMQIKSKFGGLRMYMAGATELQYIIVKYTETESHHICEACGEGGHMRSSKYWVSVLCDKHANEQGYAITAEAAKYLNLKEGEYRELPTPSSVRTIT
jgi:ribosomal protein L37AE/L43A